MAEERVQVSTGRRDWLGTVTIVGGIAAAGVGIYLFMKKPPGMAPGSTVRCRFAFRYFGPGGDRVLQVYFGNQLLGGWFDRDFGNHVVVNLPEAVAGGVAQEHDLLVEIPAAAVAGSYDAEVIIRRPEMTEYQYIVKLNQANVLKVYAE